MDEIAKPRINAYLSASERWADTRDNVRLLYNKGWTIGQIGLGLRLAESSVRSFLGHKKKR